MTPGEAHAARVLALVGSVLCVYALGVLSGVALTLRVWHALRRSGHEE